jgi:proline dehydrogenase
MIPKTTLKATHLSLRLRPALRRHVIVQTIRSKTTSSSKPLSSRRGFRYASYAGGLSIGLVAGSIGAALWREDRLRAEATAKGTRPPTPLRELVRTYVVYSLCSIPALVDASPKILSTLMNVPVVNKIAEAVVRVTFFDQVQHTFIPACYIHFTT